MDWQELRAQFPSLAERVVDQAFEFFTDVGLCIFDSKLGLFISDPQWLAKSFSTLISFSQQWVKNGVVTAESLSHVWKGLEPKEVEQTMFLFEKFGVAFLKRADQCWIVPSLLTDQNHDSSSFVFGPPSPEVMLRERSFPLDYVPFGMFGRLIARFHAWCEENGKVQMLRTWQTGIILESHEKQLVQITLDAEQKALQVKFIGRGNSIPSASRRALILGNRPRNEATKSPTPDIWSSLPGSSTSANPLPPRTESENGSGASPRAVSESGRMSKPSPRLPSRGVEALTNLKFQNPPSSPISLKRGDVREEGNSKAPVSPVSSSPRSPRPPSPRPGVWSRAPTTKISDARKDDRFMKDIVDQLGGLLERVLGPSVSPSSVCMVACPHCLSDPALYTTPTWFPMSNCVEAVINASSCLSCKGVSVPIESFDDDITFRFVPIFREDEVSVAQEPFASGAFGNIFKAQLLDGQTVVAKELKPDKVKESFDELQKETSVMSQLHHPNIVQLFGITIHPMRMILEFCREGDLLQALRCNRVTADELRYKLVLDIAKGVAFLHAQKPPLAHRDLRSPNILLCSLDHTQDVCAKVADFGLTLSVTERLRDPLSTWQWMAPEAQLGDFYTESCDLYSLGVIMFEIFHGTGEVPFSEFASKMRMIEMFPKIRSGEVRPTLPQNLVPWMKTLIENLWSSVAAVRPPAQSCVSTILEKRWTRSESTIVVSAVSEKGEEEGERILNEFVVDLCLGCCAYVITPSRIVALDPISLEERAFPDILLARCVAVAAGVVWIGTHDARLVGVGEGSTIVLSSLQLAAGVSLILPITPTLILAGDEQGCISLVSVVAPEAPALLSTAATGKGGTLVFGCIIHSGLLWVSDGSGVYAVAVNGHDLDVGIVGSRCLTPLVGLVFPGGSDIWCCFADEICIFNGSTRQCVLTLPLMTKCFGAGTVNGKVWVGHAGLISVWCPEKRYCVNVFSIDTESVVWKFLKVTESVWMTESNRGTLVRRGLKGV